MKIRRKVSEADLWLRRDSAILKKRQQKLSSVQTLSHVRLFATPWIAARQASLSITSSQGSLKNYWVWKTETKSEEQWAEPQTRGTVRRPSTPTVGLQGGAQGGIRGLHPPSPHSLWGLQEEREETSGGLHLPSPHPLWGLQGGAWEGIRKVTPGFSTEATQARREWVKNLVSRETERVDSTKIKYFVY